MVVSNIVQTVKKAMSADRKDTTILIAIAIGCLCLVTCGMLGWVISHKAEKANTLLVELTGMACGAFLGFLASPKAPGEQAAFMTFAKAISAFLSGYALSKINHLVDTLICQITQKVRPNYPATRRRMAKDLVGGALNERQRAARS
jgi:hypothetical protein